MFIFVLIPVGQDTEKDVGFKKPRIDTFGERATSSVQPSASKLIKEFLQKRRRTSFSIQ